MIAEMSDSWSWFDNFMSCVTVHIGSDPVLDTATSFALDNYAAFRQHWNPTYDCVAQKSGIMAMRALRHTLGKKLSVESTNIVITTGLFCIAEVRDLTIEVSHI